MKKRILSIALALTLLIALVIPASPVSAATVTLSPNAVGNYDDWTLGAGANKVTSVTSHDEDTSYISSTTAGHRQTFAFAGAGVPAGSTVNSVTVNAVAKRMGGASYIDLGVEKGTGETDRSFTGADLVANTYINYSRTMNANPFTSSAWTVSEVNTWTVKFGVQFNSGNSAIRVTQISVVVDYTPPAGDTTAPTGSITINSGAAYTNNTSVTLNLSATDAVGVTQYRIADDSDASGGTVVAVTSTTSFTADVPWTLPAGDGSKTVAVQYGDAANNWSTNYTDSIILDTTAPATTIGLSPATPDGNNGWYKNNVTVTLSAVDGTGSGVAATKYVINPAEVPTSYDDLTETYSTSFVVSADGEYTIYAASTDNVGNEETPVSASFKIDKTNPAINWGTPSPAANAAGWNNTNVDISYTVSDALSGVATPDPASGTLTLSTEGSNVTGTVNASDNAGNATTFTSPSVKIDQTNPNITIDDPENGWAIQGTFQLSGTAGDSTSGVATVKLTIEAWDDAEDEYAPITGYSNLSATYASGVWTYSFDTTALDDGFYRLTATATDNAGNSGSVAEDFSIRNWTTPDLLPATENNKAGRTMPIKFSLRVDVNVDTNEPFVANQELTIKVFQGNFGEDVVPAVTPLQTSTYGSGARDYRINNTSEQYITNFQTLKNYRDFYTVIIYRNGCELGRFYFETTK